MAQILSVAVQSLAQEKTRHAVNAVATGTAATVGTTGSLLGDIMGWLPSVAVAAGLAVSCALFYKTYLEIKLTKIELAKQDRRNSKL